LASSKKTLSPVATILYAGVLPNTKKLGAGETAREKVIRRALRAAKALDKAKADPATRPGTLETLEKKYAGTLERLRAELLRAVGAGEKAATVYAAANEFERAAFALAGVEAPKAAKAAPKEKAPARVRKPKAAPAEKASAEAASEPVAA
jgi:hypothetical protein